MIFIDFKRGGSSSDQSQNADSSFHLLIHYKVQRLKLRTSVFMGVCVGVYVVYGEVTFFSLVILICYKENKVMSG